MGKPLNNIGNFEKLFLQYSDMYCEGCGELKDPVNDSQLLDEILLTLRDTLKEELDKDHRLYNAVEVILKRAIKVRGVPAVESAVKGKGDFGAGGLDPAGGHSNRPEIVRTAKLPEGCGCGITAKRKKFPFRKRKKLAIVKTKRQRSPLQIKKRKK
jgi:hypothetical protein